MNSVVQTGVKSAGEGRDDLFIMGDDDDRGIELPGHGR
jgi:hypothetical protein